ncbi:MAG: DUF882 domain-containing protein [Proteobacteria bacterium]|nr:DUF882 domain-containing protein [Pseudomonadota bacterium]
MHVDDREQRVHLGVLCHGIDIGIAPGPGGWRGAGQFADLVSNGFSTRLTNETCGGAKASLHMQDESGFFHAMDVHMDGIPVDYLGNLAALARQGGVGFYGRT